MVIFVGLICVESIFFYQMKFSEDGNTEYKFIATKLTDEGYQAGYATFWRANILSELSNGRIEMWSWMSDADGTEIAKVNDIDDILEWLQPVSHKDHCPEGKVFLLFSSEEYNHCNWHDNLELQHIIYNSGSIIVFGYECYDDIMADLQD